MVTYINLKLTSDTNFDYLAAKIAQINEIWQLSFADTLYNFQEIFIYLADYSFVQKMRF